MCTRKSYSTASTIGDLAYLFVGQAVCLLPPDDSTCLFVISRCVFQLISV
jgi:hypothetical protein